MHHRSNCQSAHNHPQQPIGRGDGTTTAEYHGHGGGGGYGAGEDSSARRGIVSSVGQERHRQHRHSAAASGFRPFRRKNSNSGELSDGSLLLALCVAFVLFMGAGVALTISIWSLLWWDGGTDNTDDVVLEWNPLYRVPESIDIVGDRSDRYVLLRRETDELLPDDTRRSLDRVAELTDHRYAPRPVVVPKDRSREDYEDLPVYAVLAEDYDVYNCPDRPPVGYPRQWNLVDAVLKDWPVDDVTPRSRIYQGLCVFNYELEYDKALTYREAEVPFVVVNDPAVAKSVERWNGPGYVDRLLGDTPHRAEYSETNRFLFYNPPSKRARAGRPGRREQPPPPDWKPPTEPLRMTYAEWIQKANVTDESDLGPDRPHWYFRLIGCGLTGNDGSCDRGSSEYLYDELPFFQPKPDQLYVVEYEDQKGIHCRFGMKGVIAENHFDGSRNAIVVLGGARRYILSHPKQCRNFCLHPKGHPSARHSAVDWSSPDLEQYPEFAKATANEVVLQAGQVLYLPTHWFHMIVSLSTNMQCNTRSGIGREYLVTMRECDF